MVEAIQQQTKLLVELQKIDFEIHRLATQVAAYPARQKDIDASLDKAKASFKAHEDSLKQAQVKLKEKELDLQSRDEKIKKLQSQLYSLKSNKEYQAMEMEIKGAKADNSLLEDDLLRAMDLLEEAKKNILKEKEALAQEEKKHKDTVAVLEKEKQSLQSELKVLEEKRQSYTPGIEPKLLVQYEKILKGREGLAIVPVINQSCGGCHVGLPPQAVNEIQIQNKWIVCEGCARMLYWPL